MKTPKIPEIKGIAKLSLQDMNSVHFDKKHTVLTPELLAEMQKEQQSQPTIVKKG